MIPRQAKPQGPKRRARCWTRRRPGLPCVRESGRPALRVSLATAPCTRNVAAVTPYHTSLLVEAVWVAKQRQDGLGPLTDCTDWGWGGMKKSGEYALCICQDDREMYRTDTRGKEPGANGSALRNQNKNKKNKQKQKTKYTHNIEQARQPAGSSTHHSSPHPCHRRCTGTLHRQTHKRRPAATFEGLNGIYVSHDGWYDLLRTGLEQILHQLQRLQPELWCATSMPDFVNVSPVFSLVSKTLPNNSHDFCEMIAAKSGYRRVVPTGCEPHQQF